MTENASRIKCPKCGESIDVSKIIYQQVDQRLKKKYEDDLVKKMKGFKEQRDAIAAEKKLLKAEKKKQAELVTKAVEDRLAKDRKAQEKAIKTELKAEHAEGQKVLKQELAEKSKELKEFHKTKSELERVQREKDELQEKITAEAEKKYTEMLKKEREDISKAEAEKQQLKVAEKEKVIELLNEQLKEAQRKAEQGSMQLQGEVQELAIEDWLRAEFALDSIKEIKKGAKGADCLQVVNTRTRQNCGSIYYESKRTKSFQAGWIAKFKDDIRAKGADIGVLVSEAMPADMERMGLREGVWVCSFEEFKGLCRVLRDSIVRLSAAVATRKNQGEKMNMLYDYLTGNEFRLEVEAIVDGFSQMQTDLESEKRAMNGIWKKREKQIQKVLTSTSSMHGAIRGIAGNAIQAVNLLELPGGEDDEGTDQDTDKGMT